MANLPNDETWKRILGVLDEYRKARRTLIDGEGLVGDFIIPCSNEIRNGWDDLAQVLGEWVRKETYGSFIDEATRHFRRARSEVWEAVLLTRLDVLRQILDSLRTDSRFRVAKAKHYTALQEAFDRGVVASRRAREAKAADPDSAIAEAKKGIAYVQNTIDAFMKKAGEFELATAVQTLSDGQEELMATATAGTHLAWFQIGLALALFVGGIFFQRLFLS